MTMPFRYSRALGVQDAIAKGSTGKVAFLAGGTDLLQLWKANAIAPEEVVDLSGLGLGAITFVDDRLTIGASTKLSDAAKHPAILADHPAIAEAIMASASGQIRNMATVAGNLLQRTRCPYFRTEGLACNKRTPNSGCGAIEGESRHASIFGSSDYCVAAHSSDLAVVLEALDAEVDLVGVHGRRRLRLSNLYRLPADAPQRDTNLHAGDLITAVTIDRASRFAARSVYLKIRDRASFDFSIVSVAAMLRVENGVIIEARLAAGGVAPMPWRLASGEASLIGRAPEERAFEEAGRVSIETASPLIGNGFKIELLRNAVVRALLSVRGRL